MKIAVASLQLECNTLTPMLTCQRDFDCAYGIEMLDKIHVVDMLSSEKAEVIPTLYANALPGGLLAKADYLRFVDVIVDTIPKDVDGVWLYLHGAMQVEGLGSGETFLLRKIREKTGYNVPISLALDFHANNTDDICDLANVICGYRTAPHEDLIETERLAMKLLFYCIKNDFLPKPQLTRVNVIVPGDCVITAEPPLKAIMARAVEMEKVPGMLCAQVFNGQPWVDSPHTGPSIVVTHESDKKLAKKYADELAKMFYDGRHDFKFLIDALPPEEAISAAINAEENLVFVTDSGDNTTAGAAGDNAYLLNRLLKSGANNVLLAGIADADACQRCYSASLGDTLALTVGGSLTPTSEKATISGILTHRGDVPGYTGENAGPSATLDCGDITVVITKNRTAFLNPGAFESIDIKLDQYKIVVVKLGYLFPELAKIADKAILAFTPGASTEHLKDMGMKNIRRPMFPLDDNFM